MTKELYFLTKLISTILYDKQTPEVPKGFNWNTFLNLVSKNGFATLVYERVNEMPNVPEKILAVLHRLNKDAFQRAVLQDVYEEKILERFEKEGINCMPLKGIILKHLYPQFFMRIMSDLDILIDVGKLKKTRQIMPQLGFEVWRYDEHHDIYTFLNICNVELHKLLIVGEMENYFQVGFERAHIKEGTSHIYELSLEDFYIHILGHMAYHFAWGGVGIRLVLDIRVYLDKYGDVMNREYIEQELRKVGLYKFAQHAEKLADVWFLGAESNEFYDELGMYIVESGYLGTDKHKAILDVVKQTGEKVNKVSKWKAVLEVIFLPYNMMAFKFPILKKIPILLPFMWVVRWLEVILTRGKDISRIHKLLHIENDEVMRISRLYEELDMKHLL